MSTKKKAISLRYADAIGDTEQIHPCYKLRPVLSYLEAAGVPPEAVLYDTGIARAMLDQPYALLSQWQLIALYQNMLRLTPGACALTLGLSCRLSDLGLYGYALHSSTSLHDGCKFALRHWALSLPVTELHLTVSANDACWVIGIQPELQMEMPLRQFVLGYQSGLLLAIQRQLAQAARTDNPAHPTFRLNSVSLACTPPPDTAAYHAQLGCPIEFNARETRLYFDRAWLDRPAPGAHALTFRLLEDACGAARQRVGMAGGIIGVIQDMLLNQPASPATIDQLAARLGLHPRTLRRRIAQEGASYRDIVDQVRFRLAVRYLADSQVTHEAISERLGFSDASSFRRAFKRWTRQSPNAFRHGAK